MFVYSLRENDVITMIIKASPINSESKWVTHQLIYNIIQIVFLQFPQKVNVKTKESSKSSFVQLLLYTEDFIEFQLQKWTF